MQGIFSVSGLIKKPSRSSDSPPAKLVLILGRNVRLSQILVGNLGYGELFLAKCVRSDEVAEVNF